jgi:hypothetical protein
MAVQMKTMRMMHSEMLVNALTELHQECKMNATVNASLPARSVLSQIERVKGMVESQIAHAEQFMYPDFTIVAFNDSDTAVIEWAIVEFAWTVHRNFSEGQHFRNCCDEMVREFDELEWRSR